MKNTFPLPMARVVRGELVESIHRGHLVCCTPDGEIQYGFGDPDFPTFMRSMAKPFQAVPVVLDGAYERYELSDKELALMCGSVSGQDYHVAAVRSVLDKIGLDEGALACGIHRPSHRPTAKRLADQGLKPLAVHNNCAGKHVAMLTLCVHHGWPIEGDIDTHHPVQQHIRRMVALCCGLETSELGIGTDGCGVPVFRAPLRALAKGYARLAAPEADGALTPEVVAAIKKTASAPLAHPEMIAGDERLCTDVMRQANGTLIAKVGTEGGYALALVKEGVGIALKVEDGAMRALAPVVVEVLLQAGVIDEDDARALAAYRRPTLRNHRKETIGRIEPAPELSAVELSAAELAKPRTSTGDAR